MFVQYIEMYCVLCQDTCVMDGEHGVISALFSLSLVFLIIQGVC